MIRCPKTIPRMNCRAKTPRRSTTTPHRILINSKLESTITGKGITPFSRKNTERESHLKVKSQKKTIQAELFWFFSFSFYDAFWLSSHLEMQKGEILSLLFRRKREREREREGGSFALRHIQTVAHLSGHPTMFWLKIRLQQTKIYF